MNDDGVPLTADDVEAAASVGRLPALTRQLVFDGSWSSIDVVLRYARDAALPLGELEETVRALREAVATLPEARRAACAEEVLALERQAAYTLLKRLDRDPLTASERGALLMAATLLLDLGDLERAARTFERAGDELRAADAYGALGDLERMEACLAREEAQRRRRQVVADAIRRFEVLLAGGERRAAIAAAAAIGGEDFDGASVRAQAADVERRLCRGRAVSLRLPDGEPVRFAGVPAALGRDGLCEVVLRDPSVSRRHALLSGGPAGFSVEDLGSRGGTTLGGALVRGRLALPREGELGLGEPCRLRFSHPRDGVLALSGATGLDRALRAFVSADPLPLSLALAEAAGLAIRFQADGCRLERADGAPRVRLDGRLVGSGCDLLHGDVIEIEAPALRLEVL